MVHTYLVDSSATHCKTFIVPQLIRLRLDTWIYSLSSSHVLVQILLLVGTKLELVIMEMAQEIQARATVVRGAPVVEPNNKYFWFNRPQWILFLLHYTLFQVNINFLNFVNSIFSKNIKLIMLRN